MKCLNWKVIAALVAVGAGVYALAPDIAGGAAGLLILAACPLSMVLMMRAMGSMRSGEPAGTPAGRSDDVPRPGTKEEPPAPEPAGSVPNEPSEGSGR